MTTPTTQEKMTPRDKRIVKHLREIAEAGMDAEKFAEALRNVRDDGGLPAAKRVAIWKTLAQEAAQSFYVFATGKPIDPKELFGGELPEPPGSD